MKNSQNNPLAMLFLVIALIAGAMQFVAPDAPDKTFIGGILVLVIATFIILFFSKLSEPKPVNWLTVDVLFAGTFSVIHFAYFFYWWAGLTEGLGQIWHIRAANVPHTVCSALAMYLCAVNVFLFGFHIIRTVRFEPIINDALASKTLMKSWGKLGRLLVRLGFGGFLGYVVLVGPAVVFGSYSGTNNHGFLPNVSFQLGQVFLSSGVAVLILSRQRAFSGRKSKRNFFGLSMIEAFLILTTLGAIGLHGDRSTLMFVLLPVLIARSEYVKTFRFSTLSWAAVALIGLLGFIVSARSVADGDYKFKPLESINGALLNLGTSSICGFVAIDHIDRRNELYLGQMQTLHLMGAVPFSRRLAGVTDSPENSSSMLMTLLVQGKVGKGVAGTGTSVFADFYLDFGFWGTNIIFLLVGMFNKSFQNKVRGSTSLTWHVAFVCNLSFMTLCSRYTMFGGLIRFVLHTSIYVWLIAYCLGIPTRYRKRRQANFHPAMLPNQSR